MSGLAILVVDALVLAALIHVTRRLSRKPTAIVGHAPLRGYINYFQADPENASPAIQAAIDYTERLRGGGISFIACLYPLGRSVELRSGATLKGVEEDEEEEP